MCSGSLTFLGESLLDDVGNIIDNSSKYCSYVFSKGEGGSTLVPAKLYFANLGGLLFGFISEFRGEFPTL